MNRSLLITFLFVFHSIVEAQTINASFTIKTNQSGHKNISPYIYGSNGQFDDRAINTSARRLGGNRFTGYNWENNASNCGKDCGTNWYNDGYLVQSLPTAQRNIPGMAHTAFHDTSLAINPNMYTLLTLQMAGYVARDKSGTSVTSAEVAPSARFNKVVFKKPATSGGFVLTPNLADDTVYMDECVNFLKNKYGASITSTGIKGYSLDNEPALWSNTHARIHPSAAGCVEELNNSLALAKAIKAVDPNAEVYGPVFYSYDDLATFKCPDWSQFTGLYNNYIEAYLGEMNTNTPSGKRYLDVIDFHWYPEARGVNALGAKERVSFGGSNDRGVAIARMQAPRSLWDASYIEDSWITNGTKAVNLLNAKIFPAINSFYPNTKVGFTEYEYGGYYHISGGIAQADVLGIFGKYGVYMGNVWTTSTQDVPPGYHTYDPVNLNYPTCYLASAFKLYRNYDGKKSTFGSVGVASTTSDITNSSIYASINSATDSSELHLIVLNKNYDSPMQSTFNLTTKVVYNSAKVYTFNSSSSIMYVDSLSLNGVKAFTYTLPNLTAAHIVLSTATINGNIIAALKRGSPDDPKFLNVYPNPFDNSATIEFNIPLSSHVTITITDILGKTVRAVADKDMREGNHSIVVEKNDLPAGIYFCKLSVDGKSVVTKLVVN